MVVLLPPTVRLAQCWRWPAPYYSSTALARLRQQQQQDQQQQQLPLPSLSSPSPPPQPPPPPCRVVVAASEEDAQEDAAGSTALASWRAATAPTHSLPPPPQVSSRGGVAALAPCPSFLKLTLEAPQSNVQIYDAVRFTRMAAAQGSLLRFLPGEGCAIAAPGYAYLVTASVPCVFCRGTTLNFTVNFSITVDGENAGSGVLSATAFESSSLAQHVILPRTQFAKIGLRVENIQRRPTDNITLSLGDVTAAGNDLLFRRGEQAHPWLFVQALVV